MHIYIYVYITKIRSIINYQHPNPILPKRDPIEYTSTSGVIHICALHQLLGWISQWSENVYRHLGPLRQLITQQGGRVPIICRNFLLLICKDISCDLSFYLSVPHYNDVITSPMASQITGFTNVYAAVCPGPDQTKHQSSASLAFVRGINRWPVNSLHKGPVTQEMFPFDDVIMDSAWLI